MAIWEIDPWGTERDDMRSAVQSIHNRGGSFESLSYTFPYIASDEDEAELDLQAIAEIEEARQLERKTREATTDATT